MEWLNYHHLYYFWVVAKEGSITRGSERLSLSEPTISAQISAFEKSLGHQVFNRIGHRLVLTDTGEVVFRYAQRIFTIGQELSDVLAGRLSSEPIHCVIGVVETIPKFVVSWLLESLLAAHVRVKLVCREGPIEQLAAQLAIRAVDVVVSDTPIPQNPKWELYPHILGEPPISLFGIGRLAERYRKGFPRSLTGAPFLLPTSPSFLRQSMEEWFALEHIRPEIVGEFDDMATLFAFGQAGGGIFPASAVIAKELTKEYRVHVVGHLENLRLRFFAFTASPEPKHPAVVTMLESAKKRLKAW
jgi:LysR family transcriptional regulator, transcriptional activator of nhaA